MILPLLLAAVGATLAPDAEACRDLDTPRSPPWVVWRQPSMTVVRRDSRPAPHEVLDVAREYLGMPYMRRGVGESGFDCSGFINKVYAQLGYDLPRTSREQFKIGLEVPRSGLEVADLLFFASSPGGTRITHVAMYAGEGEIIHAAIGKGEVTYDPLGSRYYSARFVGARRILALPPGIYSTRRGLAREGAFFAAGETVAVSPTQNDIANGDEIGQLIASLTEHQGEEPPQLATRLVVEPVTQVGPRFLHEDATAVGIRAAAGRMADRGAAFVVPEVSYYGHDTALRAVLAVPLLIPVGGSQSVGDALSNQWDTAHDYTKVIQRVSYGRKDSRLYADISRTASATLGQGQIMRFYTPNIASRYLPPYTIEPDALSLTFDGARDIGDLELFVDDVFKPQVLGLHVGVRPAVLLERGGGTARTFVVATNYAVDVRAPLTVAAGGGETRRRPVHGIGVEATLTPYASSGLDIETYADVSAIAHAGGAGVGGALGSLVRGHISGRRRHVLRGRLEMRLSGPTFIPSYFDTTYRLNRTTAPVDAPGNDPVTKLALLEGLDGTPARWGIYGEITYRYGRRLHAGISYEDGGPLGSLPPAERYTGRSLMLFGGVRNAYLPGSRRKLDLYLAYHLRNFGELFPILGSSRVNEYLFVSLSAQLWRFLAVGGSIRKAAHPEAGEAAWDAVLELTLRYEI